MTQFLKVICQTCGSCENLLTLEPGPEQCETCSIEEQKELQLEEQQERKRHDKEKKRHDLLKRTIKYETESDSSNSDRPLKYTIKKVKNEYTFDNDNELTIGVSDIESTGDLDENVTSTTVAAITTTTTTTTGNASMSITGAATQSTEKSRIPTGPPQEWSVEGVIKFIADTDPALAVHAELFRKHVCLCLHFSNYNLCIFF